MNVAPSPPSPSLMESLGYVHTGPVPNGSGLNIVTDRPFVHPGPANRTDNPFPIRSDNWTSKKAGPVMEPFLLDRFLSVLAAQLSMGTS